MTPRAASAGGGLSLVGSNGNATGIEEATAAVEVELTDSGGGRARILDAGDGTGERRNGQA